MHGHLIISFSTCALLFHYFCLCRSVLGVRQFCIHDDPNSRFSWKKSSGQSRFFHVDFQRFSTSKIVEVSLYIEIYLGFSMLFDVESTSKQTSTSVHNRSDHFLRKSVKDKDVFFFIKAWSLECRIVPHIGQSMRNECRLLTI